MRSKVSLGFLIVAGSFFLYCGQSAVHDLLDGGVSDGFVKDAAGQSASCNTCAPDAPGSIVDGPVVPVEVALPGGAEYECWSQEWSSNGYSTIIIHKDGLCGLTSATLEVMNGAAGWVSAPAAGQTVQCGGVTSADAKWGQKMHVYFGVFDGPCAGQQLGKLTVVGYK